MSSLGATPSTLTALTLDFTEERDAYPIAFSFDATVAITSPVLVNS